MDYIDQAQLEMEQQLESALKHRAQTLEVRATGSCLNCGEPLPAQQRWCDAVCRDDWEKTRHGDAGSAGED